MEAAITSALTFLVGTTARAGVGSEQMATIAKVCLWDNAAQVEGKHYAYIPRH